MGLWSLVEASPIMILYEKSDKTGMKSAIFGTFMIVVLAALQASAAATDRGQRGPCAQSFRKLNGSDQFGFEDYAQRVAFEPDEVNERLWTARQKSDELLKVTKSNFETTGFVSPSKLKNFLQAKSEELQIYGFKTSFDAANPGIIVIDRLPPGHPLERVFDRILTQDPKRRFVFDGESYFANPSHAGHQLGETIYLRSFVDGKVGKATLFHEAGHQAEQVRAKKDLKSLYNTSFQAFDDVGAASVVEVVPSVYGQHMVYDELNRFEKEVKLLHSKSAQSFMESLYVPLHFRREPSIGQARKVAKAVQSQSEYVLKFLKSPGRHRLQKNASSAVAVPIVRPGGGTVGYIHFDISSLKLPLRDERTFQPVGEGFVETTRVGDEDKIRMISLREYERAIKEQEKTNSEISQKTEEALISMAESNRATAIRVLDYLKTLEQRPE